MPSLRGWLGRPRYAATARPRSTTARHGEAREPSPSTRGLQLCQPLTSSGNVCAPHAVSQGPTRRVADRERIADAASPRPARRRAPSTNGHHVRRADVDRSCPAGQQRGRHPRLSSLSVASPQTTVDRRSAPAVIRAGPATVTVDQLLAQLRGERRPAPRSAGPGRRGRPGPASATRTSGQAVRAARGTVRNTTPVRVDHGGTASSRGTTATAVRSTTSTTSVCGQSRRTVDPATGGSARPGARDRVEVHPGQRRAVRHRGRRAHLPGGEQRRRRSPAPRAPRAATCRDQPGDQAGQASTAPSDRPRHAAEPRSRR